MSEQDSASEEGVAASIRQLAALVAKHGLAELSVGEDGVTITVKVEQSAAAEMPNVIPALTQPHAPPSQTPKPGPALSRPHRPATAIAQESPMVGIFYQSPSPDAAPFVQVGDKIKLGQPIGLIEAMKVYSEVLSEVAGRVLEIAAPNGKLVQQGQPLLYVEPL